MKKIYLIVRGDVHISPTVPNYLKTFVDLGYEVHCICSQINGVSIKGKLSEVTFHQVGFGGHKSIVVKLYNYYLFGKSVIELLNKFDINKDDIIWVSRIDTALTLGKSLTRYKSVLALHELHDSFPIWKKITKYVIDSYTAIVYNEENRAQIARAFYQLTKKPFVIPNKPSEHLRQKSLEISNHELNELMCSLKGKKSIIYQGSLQSDRSIEPLVVASANLSADFALIIMGKDPENKIPEFKKINPKLIYIPWVIPPDHLNITSHCYIGVAFYDVDCLNSIYCAPNKIWEYSGFDIPVLGQDIAGLKNTVEKFNFGKCVDICNSESIYAGIEDIINNYDDYAVNARSFYDSVSFQSEVEKVLSVF